MVDKSQIPTANALISELGSIAQAIHNVEHTPQRGSITSMVIGPPPDDPGAVPAQVVTIGWSTPQTMYDAIKTLLVARQTAINTELTGMGITGTATPGAAPAAATSRR
jgi:hypothetical protein